MNARSIHACALAAASCAALSACSEQPITVSVRSLEQSGNVSFACMARGDVDNPGRWLDTCGATTDGTDTGRLYAFVTQTTRGELALIDLSAGEVVDLDDTKPGFNFIPVGGNPSDVVSTAGGTATFVGSAEANRESIWIVPAKQLIEGNTLRLTSFAACALPAAPGDMMMVVQPHGALAAPVKCDPTKPYDDPNHSNGDLALETGNNGTPKLVVAVPELGSVAVIDAQQILDFEAGTLRACPIERWVDLQVGLPPTMPQQRTPEGGFEPGTAADGSACQFTERPEIPTESGYIPRPANMAFDAASGRIYIADEDAPVIHVLDASSPCELIELPPLLPVSAERPERIVVTRDLAVSPTTTNGKKYLYATDLFDGSVMVFDISLDSTDRTPLMRPYPWQNPFQPLDRLRFSVPVREIEFVLRDDPARNPGSGVTQVGLTCDPANDGSLGASYRTNADFSDGAGPANLRGIFASLALTNGQIVIIDVEDFDAPCRRPKEADTCVDEQLEDYHGATGEVSCNTVERHQARSYYFIHPADDANGHVPGLQSLPVLSLDMSILPTDQTAEGLQNPKLLAPAGSTTPLQVGGRLVETIETDPAVAERNMVVFDLTEPRVHVEQDWSVQFEGSIPGFAGHLGRFDVANEAGLTPLYDAGAFFCDRGVHDLDAAREAAVALGVENPDNWARQHVDVLQITEDFLNEEDPYWTSDLVRDRCSWIQCRETFGLVRDLKRTRDFPIREAFQGTLMVEGVSDIVRCCFPSMMSYAVRPANQWVVAGTSSGFLHRVEPDPSTGRCVDSCDPNKALLNGRALERPLDQPIPQYDGPGTFRSPVLQFVVWSGLAPSERDMTFAFREKDGFIPLLINLAATTAFIQPQSLDVAPTGELVIADGSAQGLIFISLGSLGVSRSYF